MEKEEASINRPSITPEHTLVAEESHYEVTIPMPGIVRRDIRIWSGNGYLRISAHHKKDDYAGVPKDYEAKINLPEDANPEALWAHFENGVLFLTIAKEGTVVVRKEASGWCPEVEAEERRDSIWF